MDSLLELYVASMNLFQLEDDNVSLKSRIQQLDDQLATVISRHEREEQESDNLIKMLRSDIARIAQERLVNVSLNNIHRWDFA